MSEDVFYGVLVCDRAGVITYWDKGAESLFGYTAAEAVGQSLDLIVPADFRAQHWAGFERVRDAGAMNLDRATLNVPARLKDGSIQPLPARFVFLEGPCGGMAGVAAVYERPQGGEEPFSEVSAPA